MQIQTERIYLFETTLQDPYFLGEKDGVTALLDSENPRFLTELDLTTVNFYIGGIGKGGLNYSMNYGGEDSEIIYSYGKSSASYEFDFNMPTNNQRYLEELIGKQFSILGMRRDLSFYVIFGQFECDGLNIDNEVQQRVKFKAKNSNAKIYTVQSFNIDEIIITIDGNENESGGGFDYGFDFLFD